MIKLGQKVRDKITGFEGIATVRTEFLNGCIQYCIKPTQLEKGKMLEGEYVDEEQIEIVIEEKTNIDVISKQTGGSMSDTPRSNYPG